MANAIQIVRRSNWTVPEQSFRLRESRPVVLLLLIGLHEFHVATNATWNLHELQNKNKEKKQKNCPSTAARRRCKLIYCVNFTVYNCRTKYACMFLLLVYVCAMQLHACPVSDLCRNSAEPVMLERALWLETFALNACVNNLASVMWSGLSEGRQWRLFISCFFFLHAWL